MGIRANRDYNEVREAFNHHERNSNHSEDEDNNNNGINNSNNGNNGDRNVGGRRREEISTIQGDHPQNQLRLSMEVAAV